MVRKYRKGNLPNVKEFQYNYKSWSGLCSKEQGMTVHQLTNYAVCKMPNCGAGADKK